MENKSYCLVQLFFGLSYPKGCRRCWEELQSWIQCTAEQQKYFKNFLFFEVALSTIFHALSRQVGWHVGIVTDVNWFILVSSASVSEQLCFKSQGSSEWENILNTYILYLIHHVRLPKHMAFKYPGKLSTVGKHSGAALFSVISECPLGVMEIPKSLKLSAWSAPQSEREAVHLASFKGV